MAFTKTNRKVQMNKKIMFSLIAISAVALNAEVLRYSMAGYDNAYQNGYEIDIKYNEAVRACFADRNSATDKIQSRYPNTFKHNYGNVIEICSYLRLTQYNDPNKYIVYCGNIEKGFEDISKADGWYDYKKPEPRESRAYSISVNDNNSEFLTPNITRTIANYKLQHHKKALKKAYTSEHKYDDIDIIEDGYKLFTVNTTGRIAVVNEGGAIGYLLDQSKMDDSLKTFYNIIVGIDDRGVFGKAEYQKAYDQAKKLNCEITTQGDIKEQILCTQTDKLKEKALLKNIRAVEYKGKFWYPIDRGNEGKCYTFDITRFDSTNAGGDPIRAKNFLWNNDSNYYFKSNETKNYSIHKSNNKRKGVYEHTTKGYYDFSLNLRDGNSYDNAQVNGNVHITFYPDADKISINNKKIYLKDGDSNLSPNRGKVKGYYLISDGKECKLDVISDKNMLILDQGKCKINKNDSNFAIYEKSEDFTRPIFQVSGKDIVKGEFEELEEVNELEFKTAYVDDEENSVIKNNQINPNTKFGDAIYTTLAKKDFYIQLDSEKSDIFVDFAPNGSFTIDSVYDDNGVIKKGLQNPNSPCGDKYPLQKMILKLKANTPNQINSLKYTQYKEVVENGTKVCKQLGSSNNTADFSTNDFAIRPEYFETKPSDKITQEAGKIVTHNFVSKDLKGFNDLQIGYSKIELREDDLSIVEKAGEGMKFTADKSQPIDNNGNFNLNINFPVSTVVDLELAETNFANNDKNNGYCIGADNSFDKNSANTKVNGKIHCYVPIKDKIQVEFTSNTKALKDEYSYCNDIDTCKNYDKTTGEIQIDAVNKIGIKNPAYDKLMVGDKNGLVYTLGLISTNSDDKYVPTKYNNPLSLVVSLKVDDEALLSNANIINNNPSYEKGTTDNSAIIKLEISKDTLNEKYKKALSDLLTQPNITLSAHTQNYDIDDVKFEDSTVFFFNKNKIIPAQTVELDVKVNGRDDFDITFNKDYDVAYTGLIFKDVKAKGDVLKLKYNDDFFFGYYDKNYNFVDDSKSFKESNIDSKISFQTTYNTTSVLNNEFKNNSTTQYVKDSVRFFSKTEYLNNSKNSFTIEFIK